MVQWVAGYQTGEGDGEENRVLTSREARAPASCELRVAGCASILVRDGCERDACARAGVPLSKEIPAEQNSRVRKLWRTTAEH